MTSLQEVSVTCGRDRAQLDSLTGEWEQLLAVAEVASPFLTPGWQVAWLDTFGRGRDLFVLIARRGPRLVGLWPLTKRRKGPFVVLEPIGAGKSDWLDIVCMSAERPAVIAAFIAFLEAARDHWDILECRDVLEESPTIPALETQLAAGPLRVRREQRTVAPYLALVGDWKSYLDARRNLRSNLRKKQNAIERDKIPLVISLHRAPIDANIVAALAAIERHSWKAQTGNLKISTPLGSAFYGRFLAYFAASGHLELLRADLQGELIAFLINIRFGGKCYHYNTCFDDRYASLSPGLLLHAQAIRDAFSQGLLEYDFLSGDEPYKERWSSAKRRIEHVVIYHSRAKSASAFFILVAVRWAFRRSARLRALRLRMLETLRKLRRRGER